jgi:glutamyl/glutaminyl-tRNA synthetase
MKIPDNEKIIVEDAIVGEITFESNQIDDQVLVKSDGFPTYHLAVVVDDYSMKITHIFRGTEWIPSTPKHILLWRYLGWEKSMPKFAHVPLLLNTEGGGKLSKRQGHSSVRYYREEGYLPEAIVNYLANVVWNHPDGKEIFPVEEFGEAFCWGESCGCFVFRVFAR